MSGDEKDCSMSGDKSDEYVIRKGDIQLSHIDVRDNDAIRTYLDYFNNRVDTIFYKFLLECDPQKEIKGDG